MADDIQEQAFYIEKHDVVVDSDEEFTYEEVPVDDDFTSVVEEDLDTALRVINEAQGDAEAIQVLFVYEKEMVNSFSLINNNT